VVGTQGEPAKLVSEFHRLTEEAVTPWFREQVSRDYKRAAAQRVEIETGIARPPRDTMSRLMAAGRHDPAAGRAALDIFGCLALPEEVLERPGIQEALESPEPGEPPSGPSRQELLALL
jgi:hypothetical protein